VSSRFRFLSNAAALAVLKLHEQEIVRVDQIGDMFNLIKSLPWRVDIDTLLDTAFNRLGSFSKRTLNKLRKHHQRAVESEIAQKQNKM
jgi:hypothetical protein